MLTKDLLRCRIAGEYLKPQFVFDDDESEELAENLLRLFSESAGDSAEMIDAAADAEVLRHRDLKLARGILKTVRSHAVFSGENDDFPYAENRKELFEKSAAAIRNGSLPPDALSVRGQLYPDIRPVYGDLPENETLVRFKKLSVQEVLDRYNIGLVQGALLTADAMQLTIPAATPPADLRNLFRSLRFFRLLFSGSIEKKNLLLKIDGPASVLENSLKYGLQLACFFPSVCRLPEWKFSCSVRRNQKTYKLILDQTSGLRSFRPQFSGWLEEYRMFLSYFREKGGDGWLIDDAPGYLIPSPQSIVFPDFSFQKAGGDKVFYLELFHRWHASQLMQRLENLPEDLLIGVDRALLKKDGILKKMLEEHPVFRKNGFFFRDFPGTENVLKLLNKKSESLEN